MSFTRSKTFFAVALLSIAAACATAPPAMVTETIAMNSVASARELANASLRAGKTSLVRDKQIQDALTVIATGIKAAVASNDQAALTTQKARADAIAVDLKGTK